VKVAVIYSASKQNLRPDVTSALFFLIKTVASKYRVAKQVLKELD